MVRPKLSIDLRMITPEIAKVLLKGNIKNRRIYPNRVRRYVRAIRRGDWTWAQPILLASDGTVLDGQHRLLAIIEADRPIPIVILSGYSRDDVFAKLDDTAPRKPRDWVGGDNPATVAAAYGYLYRWRKGLLPTIHGASGQPLSTEILELADKEPGIRDSAASVPSKIRRLISQPLMVFLHYLFCEKDKTLAACFVSDLIDGTRASLNDPVYMLRERLIRDRAPGKSNMSLTEKAALTIKAWNFERRGGTPPKLLVWREAGPSKEAFPKPE